ncbi:MAG: septum formation family protein [Nocardioides sp.]
MTSPARRAATLVAALATAVVLSGCKQDLPATVDPAQVDSVAAPDLGACRRLTVDDIAQPSNATKTVDCTSKHNAQTFAVGSLPDSLRDADYDAPEMGAFAFDQCTSKFIEYIGADESLAMRTILTWQWFRPSHAAWDKGARWYRCDIVGGGDQTKQLIDLPTDVEDVLVQSDDQWLVCAEGPTVNGAVKVPCSTAHDWRAVSTIKLGEPDDAYPGDEASARTTRDYCSKSVAAWLGYPVDYDYGYTWFHEAEWNAGNRRSVCWAKTSQ